MSLPQHWHWSKHPVMQIHQFYVPTCPMRVLRFMNLVTGVGSQIHQHSETQDSPIMFSHSGVSNSLRPHGLQHSRLPCPSLSPGAFSNSCPLSRWCHHPNMHNFFKTLSSLPCAEMWGLWDDILNSPETFLPNWEDLRGVDWKKKNAQPRSWELHFIWRTKLKT